MENPAPIPAPAIPPAVCAPPAAPQAPARPVYITIDDFLKVDLRVATITQAETHPKAKKLFRLQLDLGPLGPRQIFAGIRGYYEPEQLVGRQIIVVANLLPREMFGETSSGMLLAASVEEGETRLLTLLAPSSAIPAGAKVG